MFFMYVNLVVCSQILCYLQNYSQTTFFLFTFFFIYFNIHHNTAHNALFTRYACEYMYALKINTEKKNKNCKQKL